MGCTTFYILQNYLRQLFKLRRWKSDALETTKKEMPPRQKKIKTSHPNLSEKLLFWWNPRWNFTIFEKNKLKRMSFFCLKNTSKTESRESLTKVWRKFHWNFRWPSESFSETFGETFAGHTKVSWNFRSPYESFMKIWVRIIFGFFYCLGWDFFLFGCFQSIAFPPARFK